MGDTWDIDNMELMKDDPLRFIKLVFVDLYMHKYNKILSCIFLVLHVPMWIEQYYQYIKTFDPLMMAQYGPASIVFLYAFMSIMISIYYEETIRFYLGKMEATFWSFDAASEKLRQNIMQNSVYTVLLVKISLVLALITYFTYILKAFRKNQWEIIYQVTFLKTYFPTYSDILIVIFYLTLSYIIIPMMFIVQVMVYGVTHGCFQSKMLNEYISRITENYTESCELVHNEVYQKCVFQRLRFCIIRGATLKGSGFTYHILLAFKYLDDSKLKIRHCTLWSTFFYVCRIIVNTFVQIHNLVVLCTVLGMSLIFCFLAAWRFIEDIYYPSLTMIVTTSIYCGLIIIQIGQNVEDESVEVYNRFAAMPWHTFDTRNRKMLLGILLYTADPLTISPFREFPVNRTLIVKFYKVACSGYALFSNVGDRMRQ